MRRRTVKADLIARMRLYLAELPDPKYARNLEQVSYRSWSRSTVLYLIEQIKDSDTDPALIVSEFIKKADRRSGLSFRVAYDTAVDLYDHIFL